MMRNNQTPRNNNQKKSAFFGIWDLKFVCTLYLGYWIFPASTSSKRGMTLIETLVAVSILAVAIVAPMSLTMQSLSSAYYARDQIVMFNLAQEAIESVRAVRDANILRIALNTGATCPDGGAMHLLCGIPIGSDFTIDTRITDAYAAIEPCTGACPPLQTDPGETLYGYEAGWSPTPYTRTVSAEYVGGGTDEIRITVTVTREAGSRQLPPVVLRANLYKWVADGGGI